MVKVMMMGVNTMNTVTGIIKSIQTDNDGNMLIELIQTSYGNKIETNIFTDVAADSKYTEYNCCNKFNGKSTIIANRNEFYNRLKPTIGDEISLTISMQLQQINGTANMYGYVLVIKNATIIR